MSKVAFEQDLNGIKLILVKMNNCFHKNLSAICQQIVRRQTTNSQLKVQKNELQKTENLKEWKVSPQQDLNPWLANYQAGALFSELRRTYAERGHVLGSY